MDKIGYNSLCRYAREQPQVVLTGGSRESGGILRPGTCILNANR
jgi:hypothetical protein